MPFLDNVLTFTKEYEAPSRFYYWAALTAISAILKDNVYFDMGKAYKLYPNVYVLLYGPSGVRKGPPIAMAEKLVKAVGNTRVINGRASIEAIIKELGTFKTQPNKQMVKDSCGFVVASELSSSIISNPSAMDIMTNLYDRIYNEGDWEYKLKVGESHKLSKPTVTWLSGSNEALFKDFIPDKNIHGGLVGRLFVIGENKPNVINSLMFDPGQPLDDNAYKILADDLLPLKDLSGPFEMDVEIRHVVDEWYKVFKKDKAPLLEDTTGFASRILDFLIKTAMLVSSARRRDKKILLCDVEEAQEQILPLLHTTNKISNLSNKKQDAGESTKRALILTHLANQLEFKSSRRDILRSLSLQINHEDLDKFVDLMFQMDALESSREGNEQYYALKTKNPKVKAWIEKFRS